RQIDNAFRMVPLRKIRQYVGTNEQMELQVGAALLQDLQSVCHVARAIALLLHLIDAEGRIAGNSQGEHLDPLSKRRDGLLELVRRTRGRNEPDLFERGLLAALFRHGEMAEMDRIEGPAEDSDTHAHSSLRTPGRVRRVSSGRLSQDRQWIQGSGRRGYRG